MVIVTNGLYSVSETEQAIVTQFGKPVGDPVTDAGLHFKTPFIQNVNRLEKRILQWDGPPSEVQTREKNYIVVDTFARWRISKPLLFFTTLRDERSAQSRLNDLIGSEMLIVIARHTLDEIVRTDKNRKPLVDETLRQENSTLGQFRVIQKGRADVEAEVLAAAAPKVEALGIELLDVRFKRINYTSRVSETIYERMISERTQIAEFYRSQGRADALMIDGRREKELREIESGAYKRVQEIEGAADAEASEIYAKAYNTSPAAADFYQFLKTLETYKATLGPDSTLILTTDSDLFKYLKRSDGGASSTPAPVAP
jgi:membrane protease subunit HflC